MQKHKKDKVSYHHDAAIINLIGDMKENIEQLIKGLNCKCGVNGHLRAIFNIYSQKINKLRMQRDKYKEMCEQMCNYFQDMQNRTSCENFSLQSTRQPDQFMKQQSNIFQILNNQLQVPICMRYNQKDSLELENQSQQLLVQSFNPQDSLLITESSRNKTQRRKKITQRKPEQIISKSFQQFLKQKVEQNHAKFKVNQDMQALTNKRHFVKSPIRKPLGNKNFLFVN